jgi:hypothetical protein
MSMKLVVLALAAGVVAAPSGEAAEPRSEALVLKPRSAIVAPKVIHRHAPFVTPATASDLEFELLPRRDERLEASRSSCSGERSLCYDTASGRIVYKPAREFMPDIPGLQRENISVKRDRIVFRYSFR